MGTIFIMCALMIGMGAMVFGYNGTKAFFQGVVVKTGVSAKAPSFKVNEAGTYPTHFTWNSNSTTGTYIFGYDQQLGDGSYGGGSRTIARILSSAPSGGKVFRHEMSAKRQRGVVYGYTNVNFKITQCLVYYN